MKISKIPGLGEFGIFIDDLNLKDISESDWKAIGNLHLKHLVTIIRNVNIEWQDLSPLVMQWGDTRYIIRYNIIKKYPKYTFTQACKLALDDSDEIDETDRIRLKTIFKMQETDPNTSRNIMRVTGKKDSDGNSLGMFAEGELLWHSNESGNLSFTPGVALLGYQNVVGSATGFVTTSDYYNNLSESFRSELDEMILVHKFTPGKINPGLRYTQDEVMHANMCPVDYTEIPMVIQSPGGIKGLHYSVNTISHIKGLSCTESAKIFKEIDKGLFTNNYVYDHWYKNDNDLLLFDNSITLHRRLGNIKDRLCYRIQHTYDNIQEKVWEPYLQEPFASDFKQLSTDIAEKLELKTYCKS